MTRQQYELNSDILQSLDKIDDCVMESEIFVINSILNSYDKTITIMEQCSDTVDISSFNIIQEGFREDHRRPNKKKLIKTLIMGLKKLIGRILEHMGSMFNKFKKSSDIKSKGNVENFFISYDINSVILEMFNNLIEKRYTHNILGNLEYLKYLTEVSVNLRKHLIRNPLKISLDKIDGGDKVSFDDFFYKWYNITSDKYCIFSETKRLEKALDEYTNSTNTSDSVDNIDKSVLRDCKTTVIRLHEASKILDEIFDEVVDLKAKNLDENQ